MCLRDKEGIPGWKRETVGMCSGHRGPKTRLEPLNSTVARTGKEKGR